MSYVTNVLLSFDILEDEDERIGEVNGWLGEQDTARQQQLGNIWGSQAYGGSKFMEVPLWGAAFNHLGPDRFIEAVRSAKWEHPENVRVFICDQDDAAFRMLDLGLTASLRP